jgi:polysaccharide export outer membrane protein
MNKIIYSILLLLGLLATSCVPVKDLQYLQVKEGAAQMQTINQVPLKPYRVQVNDNLVIKIKTLDPKLSEMFSISTTGVNQNLQSEEAIYFQGYNVDDHGNIRIPVLGEINVLGFTLEEIRITIEKRLLDEYFNKQADAFVSIKLGGIRYTINGEVASPGTNVLYQEKVSIMEAIANSGDITMVGDRKNVTLIRQTSSGTEMHSLDLTDVAVLQSPYFYLQPNDYILVNPLKQKSWGTGTTGIQSLSTIITVLSLITSIIILTTI